MKVNITMILAVLVVIMGAIIFIQHKKLNDSDSRVKVPFTIPAQRGAIPLPKAAIGKTKYVFLPVDRIIREVDTVLLEKYRAENDSLKKELMYKDAISIREYEETFTDTLLDVNVRAKVRGTLLSLSIPSYTIHPIEGEIDYVLPPDINVFIGGELGIPTTYDTPFLVKVNLDLHKNKLMYGLGYDTEKRIWARLSYKIL